MVKKKMVLLTGATGTMGEATLQELLKESNFKIVVLIRNNKKDKKIIGKYKKEPNLTIKFGDITEFEIVEDCLKNVDIVLHCAALVSPEADDYPELAMKVNYGGTVNLIKAIKEQPNWEMIHLVNIGTVAETGDRMPPIHWGRVGDPIKPSVHDYYAVSKIAAERAVIESGLKYWVSLRQTGILCEKMAKIKDGIIFHNCLDNVLEYVTDKDSGILMKNCCYELPEKFWRHIYNIGGGENCRISCYDLFREMFALLGIKKLEYIIDAKWFAIRNFHGQYYLDSDKLDDYLHFRNSDKQYFYKIYLKNMGIIVPIVKLFTKLPGGEKLTGKFIKKRFEKILFCERGTMNWIENNRKDWIDPFFISQKKWEQIPRLNERKCYQEWNKVSIINHGYDETKPEPDLTIMDVKEAAKYRGGQCLSDTMIKGDWSTQIKWRCAFGHEFSASPKLILEGGHWCPICEQKSWNYQEIAKRNPFFAQVWYPLHDIDEPSVEYIKLVREEE